MSREISTRSSIRRRDFRVILACLGLSLSVFWFVNPVRASGHSASPTAFPAANHVSLGSMIEDRTHAEPAAPQSGGTGQPTLLFGVDTEPVADGELPERWRRVKADIARDLETVARCHANGPCIAAAPSLIAIVAEGVGHSGRARIAMINRAVNLAVTPRVISGNGVFRIAGALRLRPCNPVEAIVRITRLSNMPPCWQQAFPRAM